MQKNVCESVVLLGDSWLSEKRFKSFSYSNRLGEFIDLTPHSYMNNKDIEIKNLSRGGLTWGKLINDNNLMTAWVKQKPKATVIHASACEVVNKTFEFKKDMSEAKCYADRLEGHIDQLSVFARQQMTPQVFQLWNQQHKFIIPVLPDWGAFEQQRSNSLSSEEYRKIRSRINKVLKEKAIKFWRNKKTLIISPHMEKPKFNGVHLSERDQIKFNEQIVQGLACILCDVCALTEKEDKETLKVALNSKC